MYQNTPLLHALRTHTANSFLKNEAFQESITEQDLGLLHLTSGRIVANDPLFPGEDKPFAQSVAPGSYPVKLYIYHCDTDQRVAFAELRFSEDLPVSFMPALTAGQDSSALKEDEFFGYGVDSGTGGFMDEDACRALNHYLDQSGDYCLPTLAKALDESYVDTFCTANVPLPDIQANIAAFSSGYGDGVYPSFWGLNTDGQICCLITDFCIIE